MDLKLYLAAIAGLVLFAVIPYAHWRLSNASPATKLKVVVTSVVVAAVASFVLFRAINRSAEYYKHVDEVMSAVDSWQGKRLQVHGHVVDGSIERAGGSSLYRFKLETRPPRAPAVITATYTGLVPDAFTSGTEIVATGSLTPDNQLSVVPDGIMAKCPSRYEADRH